MAAGAARWLAMALLCGGVGGTAATGGALETASGRAAPWIRRIATVDPTAGAQPTAPSWSQNRAYSQATLLTIIALSIAIPLAAGHVLRANPGNPPLLAVLSAVAIVAVVMGIGAALLLEEVHSDTPASFLGLLVLGLMLTSPAQLLFWIGIQLTVALRHPFWRTLGALFLLAGVALLIVLYSVVSFPAY